MKIAIIIAMEEEVKPIRQALELETVDHFQQVTVQKGQIADQQVYVIESGIGKANAAMGATLAIERFQPDLLLNFGVVGALKDHLGIGQVFIPNDFCYHDADDTAFGSPLGRVPRMPVSYPLHQKIKAFADQFIQDQGLETGLLLSSDAFMADPKRIAWVKDHFPTGQVVDMEATAIAQVAYTYDLPFLSLKTISDHSDSPEDPARLYQNHKDQVAKNAAQVFFDLIDALK
ncbi:5'-methylthioadenosine/adenosylhomocysteine nucleosidase [Aerococcus sanguinicola]|uniref:adenosylhomocysteine nucleosidase n=1 Tax=Aerococcus sanguinicola TaxID=119206 RepID=A0A0X8FCM8_9LACT|nr:MULTISPECIES: 5'-methylthioadenosine/adenosylhomocysteine nucleosidase [Aerococcus]AMB94699.1 hypothetical protein AWM72_07985 [Aerococcus sanguinicola]MDK7050910.1 5'-methylthioadenosine/adenosylhomocysteine nucleosidase [Aerococcus sanguinicola]OFT96597.1 hypothetical protein HMPREF3090_02315 [Aerococcus sp. HMSC23C02]PKZ23301.1 5'-methylthioadenosine/adenosylhomocysteine nucleosidase [Aerococcus sanguinicola]